MRMNNHSPAPNNNYKAKWQTVGPHWYSVKPSPSTSPSPTLHQGIHFSNLHSLSNPENNADYIQGQYSNNSNTHHRTPSFTPGHSTSTSSSSSSIITDGSSSESSSATALTEHQELLRQYQERQRQQQLYLEQLQLSQKLQSIPGSTVRPWYPTFGPAITTTCSDNTIILDNPQQFTLINNAKINRHAVGPHWRSIQTPAAYSPTNSPPPSSPQFPAAAGNSLGSNHSGGGGGAGGGGGISLGNSYYSGNVHGLLHQHHQSLSSAMASFGAMARCASGGSSGVTTTSTATASILSTATTTTTTIATATTSASTASISAEVPPSVPLSSATGGAIGMRPRSRPDTKRKSEWVEDDDEDEDEDIGSIKDDEDVDIDVDNTQGRGNMFSISAATITSTGPMSSQRQSTIPNIPLLIVEASLGKATLSSSAPSPVDQPAGMMELEDSDMMGGIEYSASSSEPISSSSVSSAAGLFSTNISTAATTTSTTAAVSSLYPGSMLGTSTITTTTPYSSSISPSGMMIEVQIGNGLQNGYSNGLNLHPSITQLRQDALTREFERPRRTRIKMDGHGPTTKMVMLAGGTAAGGDGSGGVGEGGRSEDTRLDIFQECFYNAAAKN